MRTNKKSCEVAIHYNEIQHELTDFVFTPFEMIMDGGDIDQKEYIRKIVKMSQKNEEEDIANGVQNAAVAETSDSDSDCVSDMRIL